MRNRPPSGDTSYEEALPATPTWYFPPNSARGGPARSSAPSCIATAYSESPLRKKSSRPPRPHRGSPPPRMETRQRALPSSSRRTYTSSPPVSLETYASQWPSGGKSGNELTESNVGRDRRREPSSYPQMSLLKIPPLPCSIATAMRLPSGENLGAR